MFLVCKDSANRVKNQINCLKNLLHLGTIAEVKAIVELEHAGQTGLEVVEVLLLRLAPLHLADGVETRKEHVEQVLGSRDVFRPQVHLRSKDVLLLLFGEFARQ